MKNILNLEGVTILNKTQQKELKGGGFGFEICPQFLPCWSDHDCPCGGCGVYIETVGFIDDLCAF